MSPRPPEDPPAGLRLVEVEPPVHLPAGTWWRGLVVLAPGSTGRELRVRDERDGTEVVATWGLASPRMERRFPRSPNGAAARFEAVLPRACGPTALLLDGTVVARAGEATDPVPLERLEQRVQDLLDRGAPEDSEADAEHTRLYAALGAVPVEERDDPAATWARLAVLTLVVGRQRPRAALEQLGELRERLPAEAFARLWSDVQRLLGPLALTLSGYHPALAARDPHDFWSELATLVARLEELGLEVFLNSGTLLGAVRDGRPLGHDYDADLGLVVDVAGGPGGSDADHAEAVVARFWELKEVLRGAGLLAESYDTVGRHHARVELGSGLPVDLFPAWVVDGRLSVWPYARGELAASALLPVRREEVAGVPLPLPRDPEALLALNYGPGWQDFDPTFVFDWAHARARHADLVEASLRRWSTRS